MTQETPEQKKPETKARAPARSASEASAEVKRLLDERKKINAAIRAEKGKDKLKARTARNRLAILTGFSVLNWMEIEKSSPAFASEVQSARDKWLTNPEERALFGLPPRLEIVTPRRKAKAKPQHAVVPENTPGASGDAAQNPGSEPA